MRKFALIASAFLAALLTFPGFAAQTPPDSAVTQISVVTRHQTRIRGQRVSYTADVERTRIGNAADIVTISYLRRGVKDAAHRPVLFLFNGGPGASSSPLQTALGPKRLATADGTRWESDNPYSPLDAADLVFIDPVGTGFSRPLSGHDGKIFWSVAGDARAVAGVIRNWLRTHHREGAPYYICGESYGTNRAAELTRPRYGLAPSGILLISLYAEPRNADIYALTYFPSFAAVAAYHGKNAVADDPQTAYDEAVVFARTVYLPALVQGSALPLADKNKIAAEMAKRLGLSAALVADRNLRPDPYDQMLNLLKDKGLRTGQSDARVTGRMAVYAKKKQPYDDPSLGGAIDNPAAANALQAYLTRELNYRTDKPYILLNMKVNGAWDFSREDDRPAMEHPAQLIGKAMAKSPNLRLFWAGGLFDLRTPLYGGIYALSHADIPPDRLTTVAMASGHGVYEGDANLQAFTKALRAFVAKK